MPFPVKPNVADEPIVADILESWSIEEIRQLIKEIEAELRRRLVVPFDRAGPMPCVDRAESYDTSVPGVRRAHEGTWSHFPVRAMPPNHHLLRCVGCLALYCSGARASEETMTRDGRKFDSGNRRDNITPRWQRGRMYVARRIGSGLGKPGPDFFERWSGDQNDAHQSAVGRCRIVNSI
jgi:hypothetical protein